MIFVTVGSQTPFDRLIKAVDSWARDRDRDDVFAQIGESDYRPSRIRWTKFLNPTEFALHFDSADLIVAHAGTGSIITALQRGKPILILPRHASLRETRNDHQLATARELSRFESVMVAWDENELLAKLDGIDKLALGLRPIPPYASNELVGAVRQFIDDTPEASKVQRPIPAA